MRLFAGKSTTPPLWAPRLGLAAAALLCALHASAQDSTIPLPKVLPKAPTASPSGATPAPLPSVTTSPAAADIGVTTYGPIQSGESLSTVAIAMSEQSGIHVAQVMWALYAASPDAFKGSINSLRVGATLNVPPAAEMTAVSIRQARINIRDAALAGESATAADASGETRPATAPQPRAAATPRAQPTPTSPLDAEPLAPLPTVALEAEPPVNAPLPTVALEPEPSVQPAVPPAAAEPVQQATRPAPAVAADSAPAALPASPAETESTDSSSGLSIGQLILPLIALAGFVMAIVVGNRRRKQEREAQAAVEQEAALRKRAELAELARGEPIAEPPLEASEPAPAPTADSPMAAAGPAEPAADVSSEDPTLVMPVADIAAPATPAGKPDGAPAATDGSDPDFESFDDGINAGDDIDSALDLARGYADMGEIDRARSLLKMVIMRGNEHQQAEAREVLDTLP